MYRAKHYKEESNKKVFIIYIIRLIFFITLIISVVNIIKWYNDNKQNNEVEQKVAEAVEINNEQDSENTKYEVNFSKLKEMNKDAIAWLKVKGTDIEYAVVKSADNSYYLNNNFEKKYNQAGWIFADYRNKFDGTDKNIIIYGHNRKDGSMFGTLKNALTDEWINNTENRNIVFITENEEMRYEVFSVYQIEEELYYISTDFNEIDFSEFIQTIKKRSIKEFGVEVSEEDSILTLSTCADNNKYRLVLHAKKIEE